jgi:hypothetical protein
MIAPAVFLLVPAILLYFCIRLLAGCQGSDNTHIDYINPYINLADILLPTFTLVFLLILVLLYVFDYFHYSFYLIPALLAFSLSFGALAISFITHA